MKRVKITLPNGGYRYAAGVPLDVKEGSTYEIEAEEIIIEGDVSLTQTPAARIPFDLEAAKAGAKVLQNGQEIRWLGLSDHNPTTNARNIIENEFGLAYVTDDRLSMAPKNPKVRYLNMSKFCANSSHCEFAAHYPTKEEAEAAAMMDPAGKFALIAKPIIIE